MELSEKIKKRRIELNLTLQEIGDFLGVSKATVQRYESGEIKNLKQETIEKLANILKITPGYLMGWDEAISKNNESPDNINITSDKFNKIPTEFTKADEARIYVNMHQIFGSDGFDADKMTDEEILSFANELLRQMELIKYKYKK